MMRRVMHYTLLATLLVGMWMVSPLSAQNPIQVFFGSIPWVVGNGATTTGTPRVTISNDSTGQVAIAGTVTVASHAVTQGSPPWQVQSNSANISTESTLGTRVADATITGRLPAGASPADAESNTNGNLSRVGNFNFLFNGTTWDRQRGDTTNGAFVQVKTSALPTGAATETTLGTLTTQSDFDTKVGSLTETAPASDTASSGLNGRLQRIAQRLTTLLAVFPTTLTLNTGNSDASTLRTAVATNNPAIATWGHGATGSAPPTNAVYTGGIASGATGGLLSGFTVCDSDKEISVTANTQLITGVASRKIHICSIQMVVAAATNVAIVTGTGSTCGTGTTALFGGTTAATGWNFAANGGIAMGSGLGDIATAHNAADNLCILVSAANQVSGSIKYAIY